MGMEACNPELVFATKLRLMGPLKVGSPLNVKGSVACQRPGEVDEIETETVLYVSVSDETLEDVNATRSTGSP